MPPSQHCRFYKQRYPNLEDVVMVNVKSVQDMGAYVSLLEYDGIEGMILLSELSRRRIRSINRLVRVGRQECVVVLRVDEENGYIDLSKRRVTEEEQLKCDAKYNKAKIINSILRNVADATNYDLEELYEKTAWKLEEETRRAGSSYEAFKLAVTNNTDIFSSFDIPEHVRDCLRAKVVHRLAPQAEKIRADIHVSCYEYDGIEAIKEALRAGLALTTKEFPIKINLIAPPLYVVSTQSMDKVQGVKVLQDVIDAVTAKIKESKGSCIVTMAPRAVTDTDDKQLAKVMEKYERENEEVEGDE